MSLRKPNLYTSTLNAKITPDTAARLEQLKKRLRDEGSDLDLNAPLDTWLMRQIRKTEEELDGHPKPGKTRESAPVVHDETPHYAHSN